jgi:hypothetical protein
VAVRGSVLRVRGDAASEDAGSGRSKGKGKKGKEKLKADSDSGEGSDDDDDAENSDGEPRRPEGEEQSSVGANGAASSSVWEEYTIVDTRPLLQGVLDATRTLIVILPPTAKSDATPSSATTSSLVSATTTSLASPQPNQSLVSTTPTRDRPKRSQDSPLLLSSFILPSCRTLLSSNTSPVVNGERRAEIKKAVALEVSFLPRPLRKLEPGTFFIRSSSHVYNELTLLPLSIIQRRRGGTK